MVSLIMCKRTEDRAACESHRPQSAGIHRQPSQNIGAMGDRGGSWMTPHGGASLDRISVRLHDSRYHLHLRQRPAYVVDTGQTAMI